MKRRIRSLFKRKSKRFVRRIKRAWFRRSRRMSVPIALTILWIVMTALAGGCVPGGDPPQESTASAPQIERLSPTVYAPCFDFSEDPEPFYLVLYAGSGSSFSDLRTAFESERLSDLDSTLRSDFEVCDLGGDDLILVVPRYAGTSVTVREILYKGSHRMESGAVLASSEDRPMYVFCDFDPDLPSYEVHIQSGQRGHFFQTRQSILERMK